MYIGYFVTSLNITKKKLFSREKCGELKLVPDPFLGPEDEWFNDMLLSRGKVTFNKDELINMCFMKILLARYESNDILFNYRANPILGGEELLNAKIS